MIVRTIAIAVSALTLFIAPAAANEYPNKPIRIVVPYPPGGPSDTAARLVAEPLSRELGQRVVVENRPGGGGTVGTEAAIRGDHDGYTLLVGGVASLVLLPGFRPGEYEPQKQVVPLTQIWYSPQILAARSKLGMKSAKDMVAHAKANPGKLTFGSAGNGTVTHLAILLLEREAGVTVTHVPYRSTALWLTDALGDRIDAGFGDVRTLLPHIRKGGLTPLAVTVPERAPQLPDVPTTAEAGLPGVLTENWFGLMALAGTPADAIEKLRKAVVAAQADKAYQALLAKAGASAGKPGPAELQRLIDADVERFMPVIRMVRDKVK